VNRITEKAVDEFGYKVYVQDDYRSFAKFNGNRVLLKMLVN